MSHPGDHSRRQSRFLDYVILTTGFVAVVLFIAGLLSSCAPVNTSAYTSLDGRCRVNAVDMRTGPNFVVRALATPHRFIDQSGTCELAVEDSNPSILQGLVGPLGSVVTPVVPVR